MKGISVNILRDKHNCTLRIPVMNGHEYGLIAKMVSDFVDHNRPDWLRSLERGYSHYKSSRKGF